MSEHIIRIAFQNQGHIGIQHEMFEDDHIHGSFHCADCNFELQLPDGATYVSVSGQDTVVWECKQDGKFRVTGFDKDKHAPKHLRKGNRNNPFAWAQQPPYQPPPGAFRVKSPTAEKGTEDTQYKYVLEIQNHRIDPHIIVEG